MSSRVLQAFISNKDIMIPCSYVYFTVWLGEDEPSFNPNTPLANYKIPVFPCLQLSESLMTFHTSKPDREPLPGLVGAYA